MEGSLVDGATMAVIGIGTVFVALGALLGAVVATSSLLGRGAPEGARTATRVRAQTAAPGNPALPTTSAVNLEHLALAAYALHLARRVTLLEPEPLSPWARAGRLRQAAPFVR
jgi:Na+-transporting methylmalonyl-CoA/oxaloacetate decarboxylase gamma subunit